MSNIYIQEPPTNGKVLLETTAGDIDIELWSREAPKACRNFIQLCMESYYNNTIFHRLVKEFIVQGGDPTATGTGGKSIWGKPFKDEFHSRLRFTRRGLVGMANAGKDDNGSQFFFTLGPTPELQNKHTLFGKVAGNTIYNMLKLGEGETDEDEKPLYPFKILATKILYNPFDDIVPRETINKVSSSKSKKEKEGGTKNYKLLSFGEEAEEEEEEISEVNKKYSGKSKSSHDLTNDPKLSSKLAIDPVSMKKKTKRKHSSDDDDQSNDDEDDKKGYSSSSEEEEEEGEKSKSVKNARLSAVQDKLKSKSSESSNRSKSNSSSTSNSKYTKEQKPKDDKEGEYYLGKDEEIANKKKLEALKKEYKDLKSEMKKSSGDKESKESSSSSGGDSSKISSDKMISTVGKSQDNTLMQEFLQTQKEYKQKTADSKKKGADREAATLALLAKFTQKLGTAKELNPKPTSSNEIVGGDDEDEKVNDDSWLAKSLDYSEEELVLAKDANMKSQADWYDISDPRNALVQRRRQEAKRIAASKNQKREFF